MKQKIKRIISALLHICDRRLRVERRGGFYTLELPVSPPVELSRFQKEADKRNDKTAGYHKTIPDSQSV